MTPSPGSPTRRSPSRSHSRRRGLHAEVVDKLGRMIVTSDAIAEVSLITDDLAEHFEVSRTVVREAFRSLESKNLISARPNVGTYVRPVKEWNLLDPDIIQWRALGPEGGEQRGELRELRWAIETFAARLTAQAGNRDVWGLLTAAVFDMEDALRRDAADAFVHADARFHRHLVRSRGSLLLNHLSAIVTQGLAACAEPTTCERSEASVTRHAAVVGALRRDGEAAERAMRDVLAPPSHPDPDGKAPIAPIPRQRT